MLSSMPPESLLLLSTLLSLPDDQRAPLERELVPLARSAALGELAADVAHDVANPLFGVLGLVGLLLEDATPGTEDEGRLRLLHRTALELKGTLAGFLDFVRPPGGDPEEADLGEAARSAVVLVRHGVGRSLAIAERYDGGSRLVSCPESLLVLAVLQVLLGARAAGGRLTLEVDRATIRIVPAGPETLGTLVAARIASDHGGALSRDPAGTTLRFAPAPA
jgi:signal transduction histidine kinase